METSIAMIKCCNYDNEIFNIGADKYFSIKQVANIVKEISFKYGFYPEIKHMEARHEVKHAYCDHKKAKELLNFKDDTNLYIDVLKFLNDNRKEILAKIKNKDNYKKIVRNFNIIPNPIDIVHLNQIINDFGQEKLININLK